MLRTLVGLTLLTASNGFASYTMIRVAGPPDGTVLLSPARGVALNNNGVALVNAGFRDSPLGGHDQAYLATAIDAAAPFATLLPLPSPLCCTYGEALNDAGQVAGYGYGGGLYYTAIRSTTAGAEIIPSPGWSDAFGRAINNSGAVAGTGTLAGNFRGFVGDTSGITPLATRPEWLPYELYVFALDEAGAAHGAAKLSSGGLEVWSADATGLLSSLILTAPSSTWSSFWSPSVGNKSGRVAGSAQLNSGEWVTWVLTAGGTIATIPAPGTWSYIGIRDINENGDVVGLGIRNGVQVAWTYSTTGGYVELGPQFTLPITNIYALNDLGQILAESNGALVLLTPDGASAVPEPTSLSLFLLAGAAALLGRSAPVRKFFLPFTTPRP